MENEIGKLYKKLERESLTRRQGKNPKIVHKKEIVKGKLGCDARKRLGGSGG